jgi:hypothetical protein
VSAATRGGSPAGVFALVRPVGVSAKRLWALQLPTLRERGSAMWLTVYVCGWLITTIGALVVVDMKSTSDRPPLLTRVSCGVVAGTVWPVVVTGLVQAAAIAVIARVVRAVPVPPRSGRSSIQLKEVLAFSS